MEAIIVLWVISGLVGAAIGDRRGRAGAGFVFGILLGPIGWLLILVGPDYKNPPGTPSASQAITEPTPSAALLELRRLFEAGAITSEEYEEKRKIWVDQL